MSDEGRSLLAAATLLRQALERTGDGLATANLDAVLEAEISLAAALAVLPAGRGEVDEGRDLVLRELARAKSALTRCRRLGGALSEMVRASLSAQGVYGAYDASGREHASRAPVALEARG